jgi:hypothetical protein
MMKFNIVLGNHPPHAINTTRDHTLIIKGGLEEAGHFAHLSVNDAFTDAVNIIYDFITPDNLDYFRSLQKDGLSFGLITTEILHARKLNYRNDETARARIEATQKVASRARFLWVMHEPSLSSYKELCGHDRCYALPLGYSKLAKEIRRFPYEARDIDFLFFGYLTPYRHAILNALAQRGFVTKHVYDAPGFIRNSMIERTKINLALRQNAIWDQPSAGRISYLVANRCAVIAERTANGRPYENYTITVEPDSFIDACIDTISNRSYCALADQLADAFERDFPMKEIMSKLIQQTFGIT